MEKKFDRIIVARTDSIGDVVLTLPLCGVIREYFPKAQIIFIGRTYTQAIIDCCDHVNEFCNWDEIEKHSPAEQIRLVGNLHADVIIHSFPDPKLVWVAKRAAIPVRIATAGRLYTISKCNYPVFFSRKKSRLHEAVLNMKLLRPLGISRLPTLNEIPALYGLHTKAKVPPSLLNLVDPQKVNLILHPLSKGSAIEWGLDRFNSLAGMLPRDQFNIFCTGTENEGVRFREKILFTQNNIHDLSGKLSLEQLISFIGLCDAMVAASTGPLHIAAASGLFAIGLYSPKRPIHPGRWAPIGKHAMYIEAAKHPIGNELDINPGVVAQHLLRFAEEKAKTN